MAGYPRFAFSPLQCVVQVDGAIEESTEYEPVLSCRDSKYDPNALVEERQRPPVPLPLANENERSHSNDRQKVRGKRVEHG